LPTLPGHTAHPNAIERFRHDPQRRNRDRHDRDLRSRIQPARLPVSGPDYRRQDEARLAAWRNDEWHFVGIRARATINIPYGANPQCWITAELLSPGLWGIESDSSDAYLQEVYREERDILVEMLAFLKTYDLIAEDNPSTATGRSST
jgi:hypothetical protein